MKRRLLAAILLALGLAPVSSESSLEARPSLRPVGASTRRSPAATKPETSGPKSPAPYDGPPAPNVAIEVTLDVEAAQGLLDLLSQPAFDLERARSLEALPAIEAAIRESKRGPDVWEKDLASAWDEKARTTLFDFHRIRDDRSRWSALLATIAGRRADLTRIASERARALMPSDRAISVREPILFTFGLPGRADHVAIGSPDGASWSVVADVARELSDEPSAAPEEQVKHLSRMMAGEAFRLAWATYRTGSPAWQKHDASLGTLEPLLRKVAEAGPIALYAVDENFFPLAVWLRQPMRDSIDELNRYADRIAAAGGDLDARMEVAAEIQKPEFTGNLAGPSGSFLADGIFEFLGVGGYRAALAGGPRAFFEAYDRAAQKKAGALVPLSKAIRQQLAAGAAPKKG
ncbi:MAG TPA: hypothetical protein VFA98_14305 [Thermoanaerobaculia bacterium]|jgi:hypothetical protein|nr:hypothetical protein [Thermoanaerobaculia bacterium]